MTSLKNILLNIITRQNDFCCLCFKTIEETAVSIEDEVVLKDDSGKSTKLLEVLSFILGYETFNGISMFEFLCKQCTHSAVNCYKFIMTSKNNSKILSNTLCNLTTCLEDTSITENRSRTLFITIDTSDFKTQQYYDNKPIASTSLALKTFQCILNPESKVKTETISIKKERDYNIIDYNLKKRRKYFSVPIKTRDMLCNKNDTSNLKCKVCLKSYPTLPGLRNHFIRVHAPKDYECSICHRKFGSIALLESHKAESHCTIVCSECGKMFHNRHTHKMHEIGHHLKLVCQDCGRVYRSQSTFKKHIDLNICGQKTRASPADAKFTCDYCNKKYTQKVSLRVHIQYEHGNYKGHECKWCKKKFWAQSRLKAHIVKHTQEKRFQCNMCGGKFVTKESLLYHTRTHTGEKPYKCEFCDSRFLSASRRADHTKRHHLNVTFQCSICNLKYTTQACLDKHIQSHKKPTKEPLHVSITEGITFRHLSDDNDTYLEVSDDEFNLSQHV